MTYTEAQAALIALGHSLSINGLEGRSLSGLLALILVSEVGTADCEGTDFDNSIRDALGITPD